MENNPRKKENSGAGTGRLSYIKETAAAAPSSYSSGFVGKKDFSVKLELASAASATATAAAKLDH